MFNATPFGYAGDHDLAAPGFPRRNPMAQSEFKEFYRCFSIAMLPHSEKTAANYGGKVFMPPSALAKLSSLHIEYPMIFEIKNTQTQKTTHAGVLEFIAEEGRVYIPNWMMQTLLIQEGQLVQMRSTSLALGKFVKIQPQSVNFLDITDPKAVLEQALRSFSTLTEGDIIAINYNSMLYDILVMETKPDKRGISIIETDLEVDFAPPLGYKEPERQPRGPVNKPSSSIEEHTVKAEPAFKAFANSGVRLNGKGDASSSTGKQGTAADEASTIPPALHLPPGKLFFGYPVVPLKSKDAENANKQPRGPQFAGMGQSLRAARKNNAGPSSSSSSSTSATPASDFK